MASSGESQGLRDVQSDTELSSVLEGLAETLGVRFEHRFEAGAASSLRLLDGAAVGDVGEAADHVEDQGGAVNGRRRSGGVRVGVSGVCNGEDADAEDGEEESGGGRLRRHCWRR